MNHNQNQQQKNTQEDASARTDSRQQTEHASWINHPKLANMDMSKLAMLSGLAEQGSKKSTQDLLPFLMSAASQSKTKGMQFSSGEMETIIQVLKMGKSPAEVQRMDRMIQMMKMLR